MTAVAGGFSTRSRSPVPSRLCGQLESNAQKWLSPDSGAGGSVDGWRHPAFAVKSVSNRFQLVVCSAVPSGGFADGAIRTSIREPNAGHQV